LNHNDCALIYAIPDFLLIQLKLHGGMRKTCFLHNVLLRRPIMLRAISSQALLLWLSVIGFQSFHDWTHHIAHHASPSERHTHCSHQHDQTSTSPFEGVAFQPYDDCVICDWDWLPAGSIDSKALQDPSKQWFELLTLGAVKSGHFRNHCNQTKSHRGPPRKG